MVRVSVGEFGLASLIVTPAKGMSVVEPALAEVVEPAPVITGAAGTVMLAVTAAVVTAAALALETSDSDKVNASTPLTAPVRPDGAVNVRASSSLVMLIAEPVSV